MNGWTQNTLGKVCDEFGGKVQTGPFGSQLHQSDYSKDGIPVVMPKDLVNGTISLKTVARVPSEEALRLSRYKLSVGDIIYGRRGDIGRHAIILKEQEGWLCGTGCLNIKVNGKVLDPFFLHYYLNQNEIIGWMKMHTIGSTMPNLNTSILRNTPITYPNIQKQKDIVKVLSQYDLLINNNERRIKILEEMAQRIYIEWFIKFKFPGYEKVKTVDSGTEFNLIPEGWKIKRINEVARVIRGTSYSTGQINDKEGDYYLVNLKSFNRGGGFRFDGVKYFNGSVKSDQLLNQGNIVIAVTDMTTDRAVISRPARIPKISSTKITFSADLVKIVSEIIPEAFLYYTLLDYRFTETTKHKANGANVLHLKPQAISEYKIVVPTAELLSAFENRCKPIVGLIDNLLERNEKLIKIRDLLIPQLVTGKRELKS